MLVIIWQILMTFKYPRYLRLILTAVIASWAFPLIADEEETHQEAFPTKFVPWFTGPLIAPSGYTVQPGHFSIEPYLYLFVYNGIYDQHWKAQSLPNFYSTRAQLQTRIGIAESLDCRVYPQFFYNETEGGHYENIGDLPLALGFQLVRAQVTDLWPAIKLSLQVSAPLGKHQHLKPDRKRTDAIGSGAWDPTATLIFSKLWHTAETHYLSTRLVFNYKIGIPVHVKGFNTYGGAANTRGLVHQGDNYSVDGAIQYNFDRHWAFACDLIYSHNNKNSFSGKTGTDALGNPAVNTAPSREQVSLAPAIEYNFSRNLGVIGGVWFTVAGRNSNRFVTGVFAVSIYI